MDSDAVQYEIKILLQALTATGLKKDQIFVGDINTLYKSGNTTVDVKIDTYSSVRRGSPWKRICCLSNDYLTHLHVLLFGFIANVLLFA
uniref:Uncharacterized protein n=1 Tax=Rhizophora mucronata TaxID=61149 RepID=A0A2P2LD22_RHIMU